MVEVIKTNVMLMRIQQYLAAPEFDDEEQNRAASLLNTILIVIFGFGLTLTLILALAGMAPPQTLAVGIMITILAPLLRYLMQRGFVQLAGQLLSIVFLVSTTLLVYFSGTIQTPLTALYIIGIVIAGLLVNLRAAIIFTLLSALALLALLQIELAGLLNPMPLPVGLTTWFLYLVIFTITVMLVGLATHSMRNTLEQLNQNEQTLNETVEELKGMTHRLLQAIAERERAEATLQDHKVHLEEQIAARTAELLATNKIMREEIAVRLRRETELRQARDQALAASQLKSELLARASHELRTPLGTILGFVEMLQAGIYGPISDKQTDITQRIVQSVTGLTERVNNLLDQAQLEFSSVELVDVSFPPGELIERLERDLGPQAEEKGLTLITGITADMPPAISGDQERLYQILLNLADNAIKFTEHGMVKINIYRLDAGHWAMEVTDTGPGIPQEAQTYIFEAFRQVDGSATREYGGFGLGLSIVQQLTHLMSGYIVLDSQMGQGSKFTIHLPLRPIQEPVI